MNETRVDALKRARLEQVVRGLCLGILLVTALWAWGLLTGPGGLGRSDVGLVAAGLQLLMLAWVWLYRWGREGVRWQFGCGYVGFAVLAFNLYAQAFLGGGTWLLTMIGLAGVVYGFVPMIRRPGDEEVEQAPVTAPSPIEARRTERRGDRTEISFQAQALAVILVLGWTLLVLTSLEEFVAFLNRPRGEGKILGAYLWMGIGGFWWFLIGRRGLSGKSVVASMACVFMAANLAAEAFRIGGSWVVTLLAFLANVVALMQTLPNRGVEVMPRSPGLDDPAPSETPAAAAGHGH